LAEAVRISLRLGGSAEVEELLGRICEFCGGKYASYHVTPKSGFLADSPTIRTTCPADWMRRYLARNYSAVDPVVEWGSRSSIPFYWDELTLKTASEREFFEDAANHGVGPSGLAVPVIDRLEARALVTISSDLEPANWRKSTENILPLLMYLACHLHQNLKQICGSPIWETPNLSPRETECLFWIARGKDTYSVSVILGLSEHTVRDYLKSARHKLGCSTLAHAVHKATLAGMLVTEGNQSP
jgi:DNA-binding CsgD family transcriptional regulator